MLILGIETSCDETSASVVQNGRRIKSNIISSQIAVHAPYFGVVPELASRTHLESINGVIESALREAKINFSDISTDISAIACTKGPGLAGSLLVGQITARTLSSIYKVPLVALNHIEGHFYAALLDHPSLKPPYLALIVSGGHTELIIVHSFGSYHYLGGTRDDAAGEAFDKVSKLLKLGYPGGPLIDKLSKDGKKDAIAFPRPYLRGTWDFSFSGLKTSVVNYVKKVEQLGTISSNLVNDICASFQQAVIDTLIEKTFLAAKKYNMNKIVIGGGVAANSSLRKQFENTARMEKIRLYIPSPTLCTDNAAMIACAGYYKFISSVPSLNTNAKIEPSMELSNWNG